ncbi:hypothetical protein GLA29479_3018 [Lysobacter antibioticus]|nr:hypothetical protein GLA29479_3018 [Lysobacter antibioticus]
MSFEATNIARSERSRIVNPMLSMRGYLRVRSAPRLPPHSMSGP